ncbi:uncharacterized protein EV420DRAFT_1487889 [Desarmillaria tabescens]|uniref:Uncharacterized protein n=1 Tax=Armillaria tabescens TaxID=1929756 RepID=A0AA39J432_ARMTA|nr:uncharacterized protein EV420DRAFT_1487889 [Desarmillaria tabescens]KAK0435698.1 hypothetical protein EV420DRAFT_1487889 [Desarmillaria tabescens]
MFSIQLSCLQSSLQAVSQALVPLAHLAYSMWYPACKGEASNCFQRHCSTPHWMTFAHGQNMSKNCQQEEWLAGIDDPSSAGHQREEKEFVGLDPGALCILKDKQLALTQLSHNTPPSAVQQIGPSQSWVSEYYPQSWGS